MGQFKILENLMLPLRSLDGASEILLVGRPMYGIIRQAMETVLPRLSGRPPLQFVVRAPKRLWADERSAPSSEKKKEIFSMPPSSSFDINGSGENDQLIVPFDVKYQYYARLWCEVPVLCGTEICCAQSSFWRYLRMYAQRSPWSRNLKARVFMVHTDKLGYYILSVCIVNHIWAIRVSTYYRGTVRNTYGNQLVQFPYNSETDLGLF